MWHGNFVSRNTVKRIEIRDSNIYLNINVHWALFITAKTWKQTKWLSTDKWINNVIRVCVRTRTHTHTHTHTGILCSLKKGMKFWHMVQHEQALKILCWMKYTDTEGKIFVWFHMYAEPRAGKFMKKVGWRLHGTVERWMVSFYLISTEFIWDDRKVLEMDSGDCCTILWIYLMLSNSIPKNG